jgi:type IV pilus assembly protein PilM
MFQDKTLIGIDIGSNAIKMVEIEHKKDRKELVTYGVARHDIDLDGYWDATKLRQLSRIIGDIIKSGKFTGIRTMIGAMSKHVFVTTMDFEASWDKKTIQQEIEKQSKYFLPYPPDEMRLSWSVIKDDPRIISYTGKQRVIINALPDFVLENNRNLLEHINLDGVGLENQIISQSRAALSGDLGNTILMDIGADQFTLSIIVDGVLRSTNFVETGGNKITTDISDSLGVDFIIAENFKKDLGLINLMTLPKPLFDNLSIIKSELSNFIEINRKISQTPNKVVFTGGGIHLAGFTEFFKNFPIPVFMADPTKGVFIDSDYRPYITPIANQLSTAIGLASKEG